MNVIDFFLGAHEGIHKQNVPFLLKPLSDAQVRARPIPGGNSIAWLLWHAARSEDVGVNLFVAGRRQVIDEGWLQRLSVPLKIYGTGMGDEEVEALSTLIDVQALKDYFDAVGERTVEVVKTLKESDLDEVVGPKRQRQVLRDEGVLGANAEWVPPAYAGNTKGVFLRHLGLTHTMYHLGAAAEIKTLQGLRARPGDGLGRAAPDWNLSSSKAAASA